MRILRCLFLVALVTPAYVALIGYQFDDNQSSERFIEDNGEMTYALPTIPMNIGICFNLFINFNRYSSLVPIFDFRTDYAPGYLDFLYGDHLIHVIFNNDVLSPRKAGYAPVILQVRFYL